MLSQTDRQTGELTGYPSIDKPWLKYYKANAEEEANNIPENKVVWDVIEERLNKYIDIPAVEYFGRVISRKEFINDVYLWAKAFKGLGVKEDDIVAYYGPFTPEVCYLAMALNMIGACPYFLKLAIDKKALAEETKECKLAIVFDQMWENVKEEFEKDRFERVIVLKITDSMPVLKKQLVSIVYRFKNNNRVIKGGKYIGVPEVKKIADKFQGKLKADYKSHRNAFITSSSGTTVGGIVKGVVATNESAITQLFITEASGGQFFSGERCLNHFPPTAATSLNILFLVPLYMGMTVVIDPRVSEQYFYNQLTKLHVNVACSTGSAWEAFFNRIEDDRKMGKQYDFSYVSSWVVGGEGTDSSKFIKWQRIMKELGSERGLASAYGASEAFSSVCSEEVNARYDFHKPIMSVGIPFAGITVGVFGDDGIELGYNQRGELRIQSNSTMKEYYNKPDLTENTLVDGWIHTGDLADIDENGFVYIWGRLSDKVKLEDGKEVYLFDVANKIKEHDFIDDAIVLKKQLDNKGINVVAHIVWDKNVKETDKLSYLKELKDSIKQFEPGINLCAFAVHDVMLPYSPTTLKKDKNKMVEQKEGFIQVVDGELKKVSFN